MQAPRHLGNHGGNEKGQAKSLPLGSARALTGTYFFCQVPSSFWTQTPAALPAAICLARARPT